MNSLREVIFSTDSEIQDHSTYLPIENNTFNASQDDNYTTSLNKHYCFETFVVGQCNRLAHAAAIAVAESPGQAYNPLFIHGASGLGKTHLLHAINNVLQIKHGMNTFYLSCERFISHYISTIRSNSWGVFRSLYSGIDAILIDDIQLFENSQGSRDEFFHIFNTLYNAKKQIVITSDCPPDSIKFLEDRLISRFKWGLLCSINPPTIETRIAIFEKKALLLGINLPYELASYLAENIIGNTREIEGAIARLNKELRLTKSNITLSTIKRIVHELSNGRKLVNIEAILDAVSKRYNVSVSQVLSKQRLRSITLPRQVAMHLSRKLTGLSLSEIGGYIGGRDHSTVMTAVEKITNLL
ncbi:MAG: chromosomal replication initiator protein DnaA, partial [Planctomycetota bacterium]